MTLAELPTDIRTKLLNERADLHNHGVNTAYEIQLYNTEGTRYIHARRVSRPYNENGCYMPFGGGSYWKISYGAVQWNRTNIGSGFGFVSYQYSWCNGKRYGKSMNGTEIPEHLDTKRDVIALIKQIGIFNI